MAFTEQFMDIPYGRSSTRNPFREFDLYLSSTLDGPLDHTGIAANTRPPLICFVHGGAWRSGDKADHSSLAIALTSLTNYPIVVPNYRLTPTNPSEDHYLHHPSHAEDILQLLSFLLAWEGPKGLGPPYDPSTIFLIGHSCGAHILASIFLDSSPITPTLTPSPSLLRSVRAIVMAEGLHDFDLLLSSFPKYKDWFLENAFGHHKSFARFSTTSLPLRPSGAHIRWLVIHSRGDTLVDRPQSEHIYNHLRQNARAPDGQVTANMEELTEDHADLLRGEAFARIVAEFILADTNRETI